jgi:hypothetical protein
VFGRAIWRGESTSARGDELERALADALESGERAA